MARRKRDLINSLDTAGDIALVIFLLVLAAAISWCVTTFVIWLVTLCFGLEFNISYATGIWLILQLISAALGGGVKIRKER